MTCSWRTSQYLHPSHCNKWPICDYRFFLFFSILHKSVGTSKGHSNKARTTFSGLNCIFNFLMLKAKQTWNNCTSSDLLKVNTCFDIWNEAGAWPKPAEAVQLVVVYFSTYLFDHILEDTNKQLRSILTQTTGLTFLIGHTENKNNTSNLFPIYKTNNGDQSV